MVTKVTSAATAKEKLAPNVPDSACTTTDAPRPDGARNESRRKPRKTEQSRPARQPEAWGGGMELQDAERRQAQARSVGDTDVDKYVSQKCQVVTVAAFVTDETTRLALLPSGLDWGCAPIPVNRVATKWSGISRFPVIGCTRHLLCGQINPKTGRVLGDRTGQGQLQNSVFNRD